MTQKIKDIAESVLALPANSRAYLAEILLESSDFEEDFSIDMEYSIKE